MKKKIITILCIILAIFLLFPRVYSTNGDVVIYESFLYSIYDVHEYDTNGDFVPDEEVPVEYGKRHLAQ